MTHISPNVLPIPKTKDGTSRRVGVEIELGGLDEAKVATLIADTLGGDVTKKADARVVKTAELGEIEIYLDTRFRDRLENAPAKVKSLAASVVPVEIVTAPILPEQIAQLDVLVDALTAEGASDTKDGVFLGFGVHFNPEVRDVSLEAILPVLTIFALLEDYIRDADPIDLSRAVLPFVDPYPRPLVDALITTPPKTLEGLIDLYLEHAPSRDHALDMTCLFALYDEDRMAAQMDLTEISARPTFHYRLPDFRPSDPDWSLAAAWNRWVWIEQLSADSALIGALCKAWTDHRGGWFKTRRSWAEKSGQILANQQKKSAA